MIATASMPPQLRLEPSLDADADGHSDPGDNCPLTSNPLQEDFDTAMDRVRQILAGFNIPILELPGYEADDVIGTLADQATQLGVRAVIVSGDKDFYQLIGGGVALLNPGRGGPAAVDRGKRPILVSVGVHGRYVLPHRGSGGGYQPADLR